MSRLQVSIDRLPPRCVMSEPRESMNCKSCRKRKIKCTRMRPSCEACKVFQCPCIYDATPKKRGPKTDVLEALLKRVGGLERRLQEERRIINPITSAMQKPAVGRPKNPFTQPESSNGGNNIVTSLSTLNSRVTTKMSTTSLQRGGSLPSDKTSQSTVCLQRQPTSFPQSVILPDAVLDAFFSKIHGKPFYILDELTTRYKHQRRQLPLHLSMAIHAVTLRYTTSSEHSGSSLGVGLEYALYARHALDSDNPAIEALQTLLLLSQVFLAYGMGKRAYMALSNCSAMIIALDSHRKPLPNPDQSSSENEVKSKLFWTCYMLDRFGACGSRRPYLIPDYSNSLNLLPWSSQMNDWNAKGTMSPSPGHDVQYSLNLPGSTEGATVLLIDITRILSTANRYLTAGGMKGDSYFPWHPLSNFSKLRQELDTWGAGTREVLTPIATLLKQPKFTTLLLSKLIHHLIHCLVYRPFLPINLAELYGTAQDQLWQIEATHLCFSHSNAIIELVELGRSSPLFEHPAFLSYCVFAAGTVHIHGVYYKGQVGDIFCSSAELLSKGIQQLRWLQNFWTGVQYHRELLETVGVCHLKLVEMLSSNGMHSLPVFDLEDFFDRYPGLVVDGAHMRLIDVAPDFKRYLRNRVYRRLPANETSTPRRASNGQALYNSWIVNTPVLLSGSSSLYNQKHQLGQRPSTPPSKNISTDQKLMAPGTDGSSFSRTTNVCHLPSSTTQTSFPRSPSMFYSSGMDLSDMSSVRNITGMLNSSLPPERYHSIHPGEAILKKVPISTVDLQHPAFPFDTTFQQNDRTSQLLDGPSGEANCVDTTLSVDDGFYEREPFLKFFEQWAENNQDFQGA